MLGTIFRRILIHLYSCNGDLVQQEVACVNQLRCVRQECSITAALTGLALQRCCLVLCGSFSPVRLKAVLPCREALLWFTFFQIVKL